MLTIRRSDVPLYLRSGSFYENLDVEDDEAFDVPVECLKDDPTVESERELVHLLQAVRFWGLFTTPDEVFDFILETGESRDYQGLQSLFPELAPYLESVLKVKEAPASNRINTAIKARLGVSTVRILHEKSHLWNETACENAARMNDVECLMYLHTEGCPWNENTLFEAIEHNSVMCLQYAMDFGEFDTGSKSDAMNFAAREGHIECMRVLHTAGVGCDLRTAFAALLNNQLESVRYLHTQGCELPANSCWWVVQQSGSVELLQYVHEEVGADLTGTLQTAAKVGNLDCLQYAHQHGEPWHPNVCMLAARGGHLDCLRYAHEHGCPWDEETVKAAVCARSWGCLMYALRHGHGWVVHILMALPLYSIIRMYANTGTASPVIYTIHWWRNCIAACVLPFFILLTYYKRHFGTYLSERDADRLVYSFVCVAIICGTVDGILEASWPMIVLRVLLMAVLACALVFFITRYVGSLPAN